MTKTGNVTVLISGRGSNLKALIQHQSDYKISHVISDKADAGGLRWADDAGIPTTVVTRGDYPSLAAFKVALLDAVKDTQPDLVVLAGFMVVLSPEFTETFCGKTLNIHPSLLPNFPGLSTHQRALEAGVAEHGCTVHFVDAGVDTGPFIAQAPVPITAIDTADSLAAKVAVREHAIYPWIVQGVVQGDIKLEGRTVLYSEKARLEADEFGYTIFL